MTSRPFQITIHARPAELKEQGAAELGGERYGTLDVPAAALGTPFAKTFEATSDALMQLERMFLELDGSFVWVSAAKDTPWQLDGVLYDRNERLLYVDLKGACTAAAFDRLLAALGWPEMPVMFQLAREAVFLDEAEFRRYVRFALPIESNVERPEPRSDHPPS
ncbi:MAG TPA: hypothetical protein VN699_06835 [Pirellulales bacterium]|nr:hypothetical protein [Pirellulales bacterium]